MAKEDKSDLAGDALALSHPWFVDGVGLCTLFDMAQHETAKTEGFQNGTCITCSTRAVQGPNRQGLGYASAWAWICLGLGSDGETQKRAPLGLGLA